MTYTKFVEIGRVAYVAFGPDAGKLVAIVDVIDQGRALVDGPCTGVKRGSINFKQLELTNIVIDFPNSARTAVVKKAWEKADVEKRWSATAWCQKLLKQEKRKNVTDFERFKVMKAKQAYNRLVRVEYGKLKKEAKKAGPKSARKPNKKLHKAL